MTVRALLRLVFGLVLALFVAASWATPSEAHAGHGEPTAAPQQAHQVPAATFGGRAAATEQVVQHASRDCVGHVSQPGSGKSSCCGNTCHAAMSTELESLQIVTIVGAVLPVRPDPPALSGPTIHIKRPPRPSAALVG